MHEIDCVCIAYGRGGCMSEDTKLLDKQALNKKIRDARLSILLRYPFFGTLLMNLKLGLANIETAATDMRRIIWAPQFLSRLSEEEIEFVMMHEVMHCVLKHCMRGKELDQEVYNLACDIVVNSTILDYMKLTEFEVDGEKVFHTTPFGEEGYNFTAEQVYKMLMSFKALCGDDGGDNPAIGCGRSTKASGGQTNSSKTGDLDDNEDCDVEDNQDTDDVQDVEDNKDVEKNQDAKKNTHRNPGQLDNHSVWDKVKSGDKYLEENWKEKLKEAYDKEKSYSPNSTEMRKLIEDYEYQAKVDWKSILNQFIQVVYDNKDYSFSPYDRRFAHTDFVLPMFNEVETEAVNDLWFLVDASGSVTNKELGLVVSEIKAAAKQFENMSGKVSFFDTQVSKPIEFKDELIFSDNTVLGGGGTSFYAIFEYMKEHMADEWEEKLPAAVIVLTDGEAPYPPEDMALGVPVLWILVNAREDAPWGKSVRIEG